MKLNLSILAALVLAPIAAHAGTAGFHTGPLRAVAGEEIAVTVQNRCASAAMTRVSFLGAGRLVISTESRTLAAGGRAEVAYRLSSPGAVGASISITCEGADAPRPMISVIIRDPATGAQRITGDVQEGTGI